MTGCAGEDHVKGFYEFKSDRIPLSSQVLKCQFQKLPFLFGFGTHEQLIGTVGKLKLRLRELIAIVKTNEAFYDEFVQHLHENGYPSIAAFIAEQSDSKAVGVITSYLKRPAAAPLYGGLGRPYATAKARWYLLAWILRDAPVQRLEPFLNDIPGDSQEERKAALLNEVRKFIKPLLPEAEHWTWAVISEVLLAFLICQFPDQID